MKIWNRYFAIFSFLEIKFEGKRNFVCLFVFLKNKNCKKWKKTIIAEPSGSGYSFSSSRGLEFSGVTLKSLDFKSALVTLRVLSPVHFTSNVNSTLQSRQKSMHWQSLVYCIRSTTCEMENIFNLRTKIFLF